LEPPLSEEAQEATAAEPADETQLQEAA
jgi:hypothetical protein